MKGPVTCDPAGGGTFGDTEAFFPCARGVSTTICHLSSRQPAWSGETSLAELWTQAVSGW